MSMARTPETPKTKDKKNPISKEDPVVAAAAKTFARAVKSTDHKISKILCVNLRIKESCGRSRPGSVCSGSIHSIGANAQKALPKSLIN